MADADQPHPDAVAAAREFYYMAADDPMHGLAERLAEMITRVCRLRERDEERAELHGKVLMYGGPCNRMVCKDGHHRIYYDGCNTCPFCAERAAWERLREAAAAFICASGDGVLVKRAELAAALDALPPKERDDD